MDAHSPITKERISRGLRSYHAGRKRAARLGPADLVRFRRSGICSPQLAPIVDAGLAEGAELVEALGGPEHVTPQRKAIIEDVVALGVALRALVGVFVTAEQPDGELASRLASLAGARRCGLQAVGLERFQRDALDLQSYLASREPAGSANDDAPEVEATDADSSAADASLALKARGASEVTE